jgi:hypothetical protein
LKFIVGNRSPGSGSKDNWAVETTAQRCLAKVTREIGHAKDACFVAALLATTRGGDAAHKKRELAKCRHTTK